MKRIFIAEKPSVAKAIANHLWPENNFKKVTDGPTGYYEQDNVIVTWSFGHILGLLMPGEYCEEWGKWGSYPLFPTTFKVRPLKENKLAPKQFGVIKELLKTADCVVNAGDPDREGQLLVDEILELAGYTGKTERILINAIDTVSMAHAFDHIEDNDKYCNLYLAGKAREQADWLVGMNLSRAFTVNARKFGSESTWKIGRVKTPTLALVVQREEEIKNFKPHDFFNLIGKFQKDGITFFAKLIPNDSVQQDSEGRIIDKAVLNAIKAKITDTPFTVKNVIRKNGFTAPPLPYSLDTLQIDANKKLGISPAETLDIVQKLYEAKIVSYPRSDCNYIPTAQKADAIQILKAIDKVVNSSNANLKIESKCWNDKKITAHHAIIPTVVPLKDDVTKNEKDIYKLIALRYLIQFYPAEEFEKITFDLVVQDELFKGSGKIIKNIGYKAVYADEQKEQSEDNDNLPNLFNDETINPISLDIESKQTTPPNRFSEGDLINAMTNIHRYLPKDNPFIEKLKEIKGIGTPATRSTIIAELQENTSKSKAKPLIVKEKNKLIPTEFGIELVHNVSPELISAESTAQLEVWLSEVAEGKRQIDDFMTEIQNVVKDSILFAEKHEFPKAQTGPDIPCPICHKPLGRHFAPKSKFYFWVCDNETCINPKTGKKIYYQDKDGKPIIFPCNNNNCGFPITKINYKDKKTGKDACFHVCNKCGATYQDKNGSPDINTMKLPKKEN